CRAGGGRGKRRVVKTRPEPFGAEEVAEVMGALDKGLVPAGMDIESTRLLRGVVNDEQERDDALMAEAFEHVLGGGDIHEGSPFYEPHPPEAVQEIERFFGRAGVAVASYVLGLPDLSSEDRKSVVQG